MPSDGSPKDRQSLNYLLRSGFAGGVAGCVAKTVVAPLDRVKILFQASNPEFQKYAGTWSGAFHAGSKIYRENGIRGLLQGHSATLLRIAPYAAIKFMTYDQIEPLLMPTRESQTNLRRFTAGAVSGLTSVFFTYPLEIIRVRMAYYTQNSFGPSNHRPSFLTVARHIYNEGLGAPSSHPPPPASTFAQPAPAPAQATVFSRFPILKFYRGFTVTMAGMVPYAGTSFLFWGLLRARFLKHNGKPKSGPLEDLAIGAVSGALAQSVSYPFEVVRRRMQVGGLTQPDRWMRWGETVRTIFMTSGWRGFYIGLSIGYLKVVPMTAVSYAVWQWEKRLLDL
ncbi:transporter [Ganoderma sinense ZZ0214-1]|uniref:Transporter n=1 Tax=Ganoderma sinense ZZ0214-1 TaxID=1077348 RepID=A0A2G8RZ27_9APHY|nr:transporter [Ganoderma sinense ZZ0214-1]